MTIENRLKEERIRLGMSQPAFAAVAGVVKQTVIQWEKGASGPTAMQLSALHEIGVDTQYVLLGLRSPKEPMHAGITLRVEQQRAGYSVEVLSKEEQALLDNYRHSPPDGQAAIKTTSAAFAQSKQVKKGKPA